MTLDELKARRELIATIAGRHGALLSPRLRRTRPGPPKEIIGMRNILVHEYFRVDAEIVWSAVETAGTRVRAILVELETRG
jgi:uncharacterized protein with HEPN domain